MISADCKIGMRVIAPAGRRSFKEGTVIEIHPTGNRARVQWAHNRTWMLMRSLTPSTKNLIGEYGQPLESPIVTIPRDGNS